MALFEAKNITIKSMKIGKVVEKDANDYSTGDIYMDRGSCKEKVEKKIEINPLPPSLATKQAMVYWQRAQEAGWIDENYQLLISKAEAALLADYIGRKIGLTSRWKPFTQLWHLDTLRKDYDQAFSSKKGGEFLDLLAEKLEYNPQCP